MGVLLQMRPAGYEGVLPWAEPPRRKAAKPRSDRGKPRAPKNDTVGTEVDHLTARLTVVRGSLLETRARISAVAHYLEGWTGDSEVMKAYQEVARRLWAIVDEREVLR